MNKAPLDALIDRLIESCADDEDIDACGQCVDELVQAGKVVVPVLVELLDDADQWADVRMAAVEALGRIGGSSAYSALERALENDPDTDVQGAAAQAMSRLKPNRSTARLLRALDTTDRGKRFATIMALARARHPTACARLNDLAAELDAVGDHGVAGVTRAAVVYIREGLRGLESIVDDMGQPIELRRGVAPVLDQDHTFDAIRLALRCLQDDDEGIRRDASQSLITLIHELKPQGSAIGREIVSVLIETLSSDPCKFNRRDAAALLGVMGDFAALPALEKAADDSDRFVREHALEGLIGIMGDSVPLPVLEKAADDSDTFIRQLALRALKRVRRANKNN